MTRVVFVRGEVETGTFGSFSLDLFKVVAMTGQRDIRGGSFGTHPASAIIHPALKAEVTAFLAMSSATQAAESYRLGMLEPVAQCPISFRLAHVQASEVAWQR